MSTDTPTASSIRSFWAKPLAFTAVFTAAVSGPLLDLYGRNPEVFVANRASSWQIVLFAGFVVFAVPIAAAVVLALARLVGPKTLSAVYMVLMGLGGWLVGLVIARQLVPESNVAAPVVALMAALVVLGLTARFESLLVWFSLSVIAVLVMFLGFSPTAPLVWEQPEIGDAVARVGNPSSVLFLHLDEFPVASIMEPDGTINEQLFPSFARLADEGTWYRNAFSASIATSQSVPATLTGRLGGEGLAPSVVDHPENLFTLLGGVYEMHVIEWTAELCPEEICEDFAGRAPARFASILGDATVVYGHLTLPARWRNELPSIENAWKGFLGQGRPTPFGVEVEGYDVPETEERSKWIDWLERIGRGIFPDAPPTLHYAHVESPHVPWRVNPSGTHYERPERYSEVDGVEGSGIWRSDPGFTRLALQRHLYQIGFLDSMLGSLLNRLEATGNWDDTLIVVTADHGASFEPGEHRRWPYEDNRAELYRVPLFLKYPGQEEGEIRDEPAFAIDLLPTIVDELDVDTDWTFDGMSLRGVEGTSRSHEIVHWCCSTAGASTNLDELYSQVERNFTWIPEQSNWTAVAAAGPFGEWVGASIDELGAEFTNELKWTIDYEAELADLDRSRGQVQTLITGRVVLPEGAGTDDVLVAANGVIAGVGFVSRDTADGGTIRALLAEELLVDGYNQIGILVRSGDRWLSGSPDDVSLQLAAADGRVLNLQDEGSRRVQVDRVLAGNEGWTITGWAADVRAKEVPDQIYVFVGDDLVAFGPPNRENANVVGWFDSENLLMSGFSYVVPAGTVPDGVEYVFVVAEFGDYAVGDPAALRR